MKSGSLELENLKFENSKIGKLKLRTFEHSGKLESRRRAPENDEDPRNKILKVLDLNCVSIKNMNGKSYKKSVSK